jgi:hypothetical protein
MDQHGHEKEDGTESTDVTQLQSHSAPPLMTTDTSPRWTRRLLRLDGVAGGGGVHAGHSVHAGHCVCRHCVGIETTINPFLDALAAAATKI